MHTTDTIQALASELGLLFKANSNAQQFRELADRINDLLLKDFDRLIAILYRMDVSDIKLKQLLKAHPGEDAGMIIAGLMLERQAQRIRSRQEFRKKDEGIDENEKW